MSDIPGLTDCLHAHPLCGNQVPVDSRAFSHKHDKNKHCGTSLTCQCHPETPSPLAWSRALRARSGRTSHLVSCEAPLSRVSFAALLTCQQRLTHRSPSTALSTNTSNNPLTSALAPPAFRDSAACTAKLLLSASCEIGVGPGRPGRREGAEPAEVRVRGWLSSVGKRKLLVKAPRRNLFEAVRARRLLVRATIPGRVAKLTDECVDRVEDDRVWNCRRRHHHSPHLQGPTGCQLQGTWQTGGGRANLLAVNCERAGQVRRHGCATGGRQSAVWFSHNPHNRVCIPAPLFLQYSAYATFPLLVSLISRPNTSQNSGPTASSPRSSRWNAPSSE